VPAQMHQRLPEQPTFGNRKKINFVSAESLEEI